MILQSVEFCENATYFVIASKVIASLINCCKRVLNNMSDNMFSRKTLIAIKHCDGNFSKCISYLKWALNLLNQNK